MSARLPFNRKSPADKAEQRRAEINTINRHGTNLFFKAVEGGKLHEVANMIDEGADLDARTTSRGMLSSMMVSIPYGVGATPLHAACLLGSTEIVQYLLKYGANPHAKDEAGHTPMDYALLSHSFFEDELNRKEQSRFAFRSTVNKAAARVEDYDNVIAQLIARKAKPGMFELPERFRMGQPGGSLPPAPPLP
ncbi:MAG: ankyrin repeat domain-containing protein [Alphaproteobacteria bacterium]|nr:ankyrin repeat domain-containing protein [Alphaproteobacteria bacterium]